ncbi:MAG: exosortase/archaeosortase family protein [Patescibacteria group bacterium]
MVFELGASCSWFFIVAFCLVCMKKVDVRLLDIVVRYVLIFVLGLFDLFIFYFVFTPLTIDFVGLVLGLFVSYELIGELGNVFFVSGIEFVVVRACVAGAAYYLLCILVLGMPGLDWGKRAKALLYSFGLFYGINVVRIVMMILLYVYWGAGAFEIVHMFLWYGMSILIVAGVWFFVSSKMGLKGRPVVDDLRFVWKQVRK